jgi:aspartate/methionine/tyrosine aminotransferase
MSFFKDSEIPFELLRKHSKNRWGGFPDDVIPLTAADPDFRVAPEIREAIEGRGREGVFSYREGGGNRDFKEVIVETVRERKKIDCIPDDVMLTNGVAQGMMIVAKYACQHGDEAIIFDPVARADAFLLHLQKVRDYAHERLDSIDGVSCRKPEGTYALFPDVSSFGMTSEDMAEYLLNEARVAVVPGHGESFSYFGPGTEGNIRIVFSTSKEVISEALDRIEEALSKIR